MWHCSVRAAPGDRLLSDAEWGGVADSVIDGPASRASVTISVPVDGRSGTRRTTSISSPRWPGRTAAVLRPGTTSSGCGMPAGTRSADSGAATAPADRTAARPPARAETELAIRRGWTSRPAPRCTGGMHRGGRSRFGAGVLRPIGARRGARAEASQHHQPRRGHWLRGWTAGPHDQGRERSLVRRREARLRSTLPSSGPAGPGRRRWLARPVHSVMARAVLRARVMWRRNRRRTRPGSSPSCARAVCWCDYGSARSTRARSPATRSRSPRTPARTEAPVVRGRAARGRAGTAPVAPPVAAGPHRCSSGSRIVPVHRAGRDMLDPHAARQAEAARSSSGAALGRSVRGRRYGLGGGRDVPDAPPERSEIRRCAWPPIPTTGPRGPLTESSRTGPPRAIGSALWLRLLSMIGGSEEDSAMPGALTLAASLVRLAKAVSELRQASSTPRRRRPRGRQPSPPMPRSANHGQEPPR